MAMNEQEKKFVDRYVMIFFHTAAVKWEHGVAAMDYAGYDLPADLHEADHLAKALIEKLHDEIDAEISRTRKIFDCSNAVNLWNIIIQSKPVESPADAEEFDPHIYIH